MNNFLEQIQMLLVSVGVSMMLITYTVSVPQLETTIDIINLSKEIKSIKENLEGVSSEIESIKNIINKSSGTNDIDVVGKLAELEFDSDKTGKYIAEINKLIHKDPEVWATVRDINTKYEYIIKNLDSVKSDVDRVDSKTHSDLLGRGAMLMGFTMFILGLLTTLILQKRKSEKS